VAKTIKGFKINWAKAIAATAREKERCINIGALPRVHSSHNSDYSDGSAQLRGHGVKEKSSAFMFEESNFTKKSQGGNQKCGKPTTFQARHEDGY
jgi:hypothetical protein